MSTANATIIAAIKAMCRTDGVFTSRGADRISIGCLPHDKDTVQFIVAGYPVFSLTFIGHRAEFSCSGFGNPGMTDSEMQQSAGALNFMFEAIGFNGFAATDNSYLHISSDNDYFLKNMSVFVNDIALDEFYEHLNDEAPVNSPKL